MAKTARSLAATLLRYIAGHDGREFTADEITAWAFQVSENPTITEAEWRNAIERYYSVEGVRNARPGDVLAAAKRLRDRRIGLNRVQLESNPQRVPCPPELRYQARRAS